MGRKFEEVSQEWDDSQTRVNYQVAYTLDSCTSTPLRNSGRDLRIILLEKQGSFSVYLPVLTSLYDWMGLALEQYPSGF